VGEWDARKLACDMDCRAKSAVVVIQPNMQWKVWVGKAGMEKCKRKRNAKQYTPNLGPK